MKPMSQAPVNDWLTYGREEGRMGGEAEEDDDGVQCFSLCLFKDARPFLLNCRARRLGHGRTGSLRSLPSLPPSRGVVGVSPQETRRGGCSERVRA